MEQDLLTRAHALLQAFLNGGAILGAVSMFGLVLRFFPKISNRLIPALQGLALVLLDLWKVVGKFGEAGGASPMAVSMFHGDPVLVAGFWGSLAGAGVAFGTAAYAAAQGAAARWLYEKYLRHATVPPPGPDAVKGRPEGGIQGGF